MLTSQASFAGWAGQLLYNTTPNVFLATARFFLSAFRRLRVSGSQRGGAAGMGHASIGVHAEPRTMEGGCRSL